MATCYYCSGSARCAGCGGTGVQADGRVCNLCGGNGRCQHCTNGVMRVAEETGPQRMALSATPRLASLTRAILAFGYPVASRARLARHRLLAIAVSLVAGLMTATGAQAQVVGTPGNTTTTSTSESIIFQTPVTTTVTSNSYSTQVLGRVNGGTVYDQTFGVAVSNPAVQSAFGTATLAVTNAGGPGVVIAAPHLVSSTTTTSSNTTTVYSVAPYSGADFLVTPYGRAQGISTAEVVIGPGSTLIGQRTVCTGLSGLPGATRPTCGAGTPTQFTVVGGEFNVNVNIETVYRINQTNTTTLTSLLSEIWAVDGYVQSIGVVHTAVQSGAFDATSRFLRRMGDETGNGSSGTGFGPAKFGGWAEVYGATARTSADGDIPGDRRRAYGLAGGFNALLTENLVLGFGIDQGRTDIDLDRAFQESGTVNLTQFGVNAGYRSGPFFVNAAATYGVGDADTTHSVGGASTASYNLATWGVLGETGYRFDLGGLWLTPSIGLDYTSVHSDSFTETGGLALAANGYTADRTRAWLGLRVGHSWQMASGGSFDLSAYGRVVDVLSGQDRLLPVTFAATPGTPMTITGNKENRVGFDLGVKASYTITDRTSLFAGYDGAFRDGFSAHQGRVGLKVNF